MTSKVAEKRFSFKQLLFRILHGSDGGASFEKVLSAELTEVSSSRKIRLGSLAESLADAGGCSPGAETHDPCQKACGMKLAGLAFSGGGIRSATFNLGILQGLARIGFLRRFDYLSTVSGGGYIGSWLSAWIKREGSIGKVEVELSRQSESGTNHREPDPIIFMRKYSNYLTPKMGMLSADTWALIATYLRNLTLNLLTITAFFLAVFLLPHLTVWYARFLTTPGSLPFVLLFDSALLYLAVGIFFISLNQAYWSVKRQRTDSTINYPWYARQWAVLVFVVLPVMLSALLGGIWVWSYSTHNEPLKPYHALAFFCSTFGSWLAGAILARFHASIKLVSDKYDKQKVKAGALTYARESLSMVGDQVKNTILSAKAVRIVVFLFWMAPSLLVGCGLFSLLVKLLRHWSADDPSSLWYAVNFSPPLVLVVYMSIGTVLIGLMGRQMPDDSREWWSRLGGWLLICAVLWTILCAIAFFSLPVIAKATALISSAWVISTISGVLLGKSPLTGEKGSKKWIEILAAVLPSVFVVGLLMFISFMTSGILVWAHADWDTFWTILMQGRLSCDELLSANFLIMSAALDVPLGGMFMVSLVTALALSWRIDINQFSIHLLYRNRLTRGYLGASIKNRQGQPFAGFDPNDDLPASDLQTSASYAGPYPIVNTALNIVKGKKLAWQTRKAASFTFSPLYSGYEALSSNGPRKTCCYQPTADYGKPDGMSLGTAMAISGAAASPNMGYHSSPALAFLMTVFNVRLGWWSGNPLYPKNWQKAGPTFGLWYMLKELFGLADDESGFVYLSDGGHFENLGIYELAKRRCRLIIACDAGQDKGMKFDDLGNALRKMRVDLGVDIAIDVSPIRDRKKHCALGKIVYHTRNGKEEYGDLIYIKTSLCGQEPADVYNYKRLHEEFPHQTTADQWFDEDQFESYRMLGLHTILEMCEGWEGPDVETLVKKVEQYIEKSDVSPDARSGLRSKTGE